MRGDAQRRQGEWETVDKPEERLYADDGVDESAKETSGEDGVLLDELGQIVESRGYGEGEKTETKEEA